MTRTNDHTILTFSGIGCLVPAVLLTVIGLAAGASRGIWPAFIIAFSVIGTVLGFIIGAVVSISRKRDMLRQCRQRPKGTSGPDQPGE